MAVGQWLESGLPRQIFQYSARGRLCLRGWRSSSCAGSVHSPSLRRRPRSLLRRDLFQGLRSSAWQRSPVATALPPSAVPVAGLRRRCWVRARRKALRSRCTAKGSCLRRCCLGCCWPSSSSALQRLLHDQGPRSLCWRDSDDAATTTRANSSTNSGRDMAEQRAACGPVRVSSPLREAAVGVVLLRQLKVVGRVRPSCDARRRAPLSVIGVCPECRPSIAGAGGE